MKLTSKAFEHNGEIPSHYTCEGDNMSPPLEIHDIPKNTKSLVLIMDDPDIPDFVKQKFNIQVWDHWTVFNIDPRVKVFREGLSPGIIGKNTSGESAYTGPCPPDKRHRYFFRLYALDKLLEMREGVTKQQVLDAIKGHVIAEAELIGTYDKKNK